VSGSPFGSVDPDPSKFTASGGSPLIGAAVILAVGGLFEVSPGP
jgi:hypothetical protein